MGEIRVVQIDENAQKLKRIRREITKNLTELGLYKREYNMMIDKLADLLLMYDKLIEQMRASGYNVVSETAAGGEKRSAAFTALESVYKQIATYSDRLCLNPKAMLSVRGGGDTKSGSKLDEVLAEIRWP